MPEITDQQMSAYVSTYLGDEFVCSLLDIIRLECLNKADLMRKCKHVEDQTTALPFLAMERTLAEIVDKHRC